VQMLFEESPEASELKNGLTSLFDIALYTLEQSRELFLRSRRSELSVGKSDEGRFSRLGQTIPVFAMTLACSLGLALEQWKKKGGLKGDEKIERALRVLFRDLMNEEFQDENGSSPKSLVIGVRAILKRSLVRHSYPMINRLHALKLLIDDTVLGDGEKEKILPWTYELLEMEANLNAPLHFTPLHSGATCAMVCLFQAESALHYTAESRLLSSQEMYTMRRAFYENISDLYYLYDDFNDRQLHFNHGIQMAGAELATLLQCRLAAKSCQQPRPHEQGEDDGGRLQQEENLGGGESGVPPGG